GGAAAEAAAFLTQAFDRGLVMIRLAAVASMILIAGSSVISAQQNASGAAKVTIDADGTVHIPAMSVPASSLSSESARKNFLDFARGFAALSEGLKPGADVKAARQRLDEVLMRPGVEELRAAFPVTIQPEVIGGVQTDVVEPAGGVAKKNKSR